MNLYALKTKEYTDPMKNQNFAFIAIVIVALVLVAVSLGLQRESAKFSIRESGKRRFLPMPFNG